jgi:hypothetical protein
MTGVDRIPSGLIGLKHCPPEVLLLVDGVPMLRIHTIAPVVSSRAYTLLFMAATMKAPLPPGPFSMYSGEDHTLPVNVAVKVVSRAIRAAAALVNVG